MSTEVDYAKQLRAILLASPDAIPLDDFLSLLDAEVAPIYPDAKSTALNDLERDLQTIYDEAVDHASLHQLETFIEVLHRLKSIISASSLISTWFDLLLRPALREPRLSVPAVNQAKELVITALENYESSPQRVGEFRRRVMDHYLLDALNEGSGEDVLEWAELDEDQREKRAWWKANLEDTLVRFGQKRPNELMTVAYHCFTSSTFRLQILMLLDSLISHPAFVDIAPSLTSHPMLSSLLLSLQLDKSSTVCTFGLATLIKLLPIMAVRASADLQRLLPQLLAILGRIICWKASKYPSTAGRTVAYTDLLDQRDSALIDELEHNDIEEQDGKDAEPSEQQLQIREDLTWEALERSFDRTASSAPSTKAYFTLLYYLFPCNTMAFLRKPGSYLRDNAVESPYTVGWEEVIDDGRIKSESESLLRGHLLHPSIIWRDSKLELEEHEQWASYDISRILGESVMLELSNAAVVYREESARISESLPSSNPITGDPKTPTIKDADISRPHRKHVISIEDMIATSVALKCGADVEIIDPRPTWPSSLFLTGQVPPTAEEGSSSFPPAQMPSSSAGGYSVPSHIIETIAGLQREVLLLRNELNLELWLKRENVRHIGRLHKDRLTTKGAELERQGLHNKLREYKGQLVYLQRELKKHQGQAFDMKQKYSEWNSQLQTKLNDLREQKKAWQTEATEMKANHKEAKAHLAAQGRLLADAQNKVFLLESQIKEDAHKVQRLRDYEKRIEQLTAMQRMWNDDVRRFNEQTKEVEILMSDYQKMKLRLESYEKALAETEETDRANRRRIQSLEANLRAERQSSDEARRNPVQNVVDYSTERVSLAKSNEKLRVENAELRDEMEEMRAMVEVLKAQLTQKRGLVEPDIELVL